MQKALLFHSLSGQEDQGFLHVKCTLRGDLDIEAFQKSWDQVIQRHEVFRTSVHWEKLDKPLQVIHPNATLAWTFEDWTDMDEKQKSGKLETFVQADRKVGLDFTKVPLSRMALFKYEKDKHLLLWTCHHILLDGWSASNVLKDVFSYYESILTKHKLELESIPSSKDYLKELQTISDHEAEQFWKSKMSGFSAPSLVAENNSLNNENEQFVYQNCIISADEHLGLKEVAKKYKITNNTLIQGLWSLVVSTFTNKEDIAFGTIASVRPERLKNVTLMSGLFTNMLPVRIKTEPSESLATWLQNIQKQEAKVRKYAHVTLDKISEWIDWPGYLPVFDHLLVVENFPWKDFEKGGVKVQDFKSGITTTFPFTVIVKPLETLDFGFKYKLGFVSPEAIDWFKNSLQRLVKQFIANPEESLSTLCQTLSATPKINLVKNGVSFDRTAVENLIQPATPLELKLTTIWETVFGRNGISVTDNFFEIGGKSILAVRLFAQIEKQLGHNLPPITLLQHPTIRDISNLISGEVENKKWESLIPIRSEGTKKPLFCLHAKGGHVFFYNAMVGHLSKDQPVYALQPKGLDGIEPLYESIEQMAESYIEEILSIQPEGPYNLLATCFSNAVGLEIAHQLKQKGSQIALLAMVDASPGNQDNYLTQQQNNGLISKVIRNLKEKSLLENGKKIAKKIIKKSQKKKELTLSEQEKRMLKIESSSGTEIVLNEQEKRLLSVQRSLDQIFKKYVRKPYDGEITLIRSSEFSQRADKDFHVKGWEDLVVEENLNVLVVSGHHRTLFIEPEVQGLAKELEKRLNLENNSGEST